MTLADKTGRHKQRKADSANFYGLEVLGIQKCCPKGAWSERPSAKSLKCEKGKTAGSGQSEPHRKKAASVPWRLSGNEYNTLSQISWEGPGPELVEGQTHSHEPSGP